MAREPTVRAGEVDLILRDRDGARVFCEVWSLRIDGHGDDHGGGAASVTPVKQWRLVHAAQLNHLSSATLAPCQFGVVARNGKRIEWTGCAFDLSAP